MRLGEFARKTKGRPLPPVPKVALELAEGGWAVKIEVEGEVGYLHVGADGISLGELLTWEDIGRLRMH